MADKTNSNTPSPSGDGRGGVIYCFLATGFEEVEALAPIDIMRRAGLPVTTVSVMADQTVCGAHGVPMVADKMFADCTFDDATMLFLPGGLPGSTNLDAHDGLRQAIVQHHTAGKWLAAICAAPMVYGHLGLLRGVKATCYPGCESEMPGADYTAALVEVDGQFITGKGPAAAMELGYTIVELLKDRQTAQTLRDGMQYSFLMER